MSHIPERKEKNCLNCGTTVQGRYCHVCGQENVEPKETFWHMFTHFFYDITHFDSSFFTTVKDLIFKPGFLSKEYVKGKRASYLHPVRMYVFTSAMFFLVFFSFFKKEGIKTNFNEPITGKQKEAYIKSLKERLKEDSSNVLKQALSTAIDTTHLLTVKDTMNNENEGVTIKNRTYKSPDEYDSIQRTLPRAEKDGWVKKRIIKKIVDLNNRFKGNPDEAIKEFSESLLHRLPYMLFISLPLFALLLKLVYIRRKQFLYVDHGVFTIHLYIFTFLLLMAVFLVNAIENWIHVGALDWIIAILFIGLFFYLYKGMRNFYGQRRAKTIFKFLFVTFFSLMMMLILFVAFVFFSAATL